MRYLILVLAALFAVPASAAAAAPAPAPAKSDPKPTSSAGSDEDEDEAPKPAPANAQPAPAPLGAVSTSPAEQSQQRLVSGAPLYNPNVAVHIVEQKEFADRWSREVTIYPAAVQLNGKFTQHLGAALGFTWHLQENFALTAMGIYNYVSSESAFQGELIDKVSAESQAASSLLLVGGAIAGVEVTPFYGKFVFYDSYLVHFALVLSAGAGAGATRHQLKPKNDCTLSTAAMCVEDPTFGDTGWRFLAEIGGGFRVQFLKWLTFRLELRDLVYTARVDHVDGCDVNDLKAMDQQVRAGKMPSTATVGPSCGVTKYDGVNPDTMRKNSDDVTLAYNLVKTPSSDVLNNLGLYVGLSVDF
jgi:outer membrane beta-barrel protein